ncbi:MAG: carboxypeptidase regulatory-like domain-containing protein [Acidobacteria bacterium]|nr:carboxypeptidase regulatory-like domain-containing protein [Acidobacteriota bacterium]
MQPNSFVRFFCLFALAFFPTLATAQTRSSELQRDVRPRNCSISGRVTINGQPAVNVQVSAVEAPAHWDQPQPILQSPDGSIHRSIHQTRTDGDGRYQMNNLPTGRYLVVSGSKAFVSSNANQPNSEPKTLTLDAGESQTNVDFSLVRGGVITGQVTDSEGRPVIAHSLRLFRVTVEPNGQRRLQPHRGEFGEGTTDDRGVYRIYGLPPGNYVVGAGGENFFSDEKYPPVFYPDAANENQAQIIEVNAGKEVTNINLRLGAMRKRYVAIGRVIEADTGNPVPNVHVSGEKIRSSPEGGDDEGGGSDYSKTDRMGNFRLTGLSRGTYKTGITSGWDQSSEFYAEPSSFEIVDGDISDVEIKAIRGGVISGTSSIEGSTDLTIKSKLTQIWVYAQTESEGEGPPTLSNQPLSHSRSALKPDGSFLLTGIAPGKIMFGVQPFGAKPLSLLRIERGGVEIKNEIEVAKGEIISNVRLIFTAGSGIIRGQVQTIGGQPLPSGWKSVGAKLVGNLMPQWFEAQVDEKGRFEFLNLPGGEYELELSVSVSTGPGQMQRLTADKQKVTVASGAEARVTMTYDPTRKPQEEKND